MARDPMTYRAQRRNICIRQNKEAWTPQWYHADHYNRPDWLLAQDHNKYNYNRMPIYIPYDPQARKERTKASRKSAIYRASRKGDWAAAARAYFDK